MEKEEVIRKQLLELLRGGNAHMTFDEAIAEFPMHLINSKAPGMPYAPWHILEHMRIVQWDIVEFIQNSNHASPEWPQGYFPSPKETADEAGWQKTINRFLADLEVLKDLATDRSLDLFTPIPHAKGYTIYREILLAADHNAYHIGEFAFMRQVMNAWPPDRVLYDAE